MSPNPSQPWLAIIVGNKKQLRMYDYSTYQLKYQLDFAGKQMYNTMIHAVAVTYVLSTFVIMHV